jgi:hypothetical protein
MQQHGVGVAHAVVGGEQAYEEHDRGAHRHLRRDADAEPHHEERRQRRARQSVDGDEEGVEDRVQAWRECQHHARHDPENRTDHEGEERLPRRHIDVRLEHAAVEEIDEALADRRRRREEIRVEPFPANGDLPGPERDHEHADAPRSERDRPQLLFRR